MRDIIVKIMDEYALKTLRIADKRSQTNLSAFERMFFNMRKKRSECRFEKGNKTVDFSLGYNCVPFWKRIYFYLEIQRVKCRKPPSEPRGAFHIKRADRFAGGKLAFRGRGLYCCG